VHKSFFDLIKEAQQHPLTPIVGATLSVHHADSTVLFGLGALKYYADIPGLPGSGIPPLGKVGSIPIRRTFAEGFSSRTKFSFKTFSSKEQSYIVRGTWGEAQPFIVVAAQIIDFSVYIPPKTPHNPFNPQTVVMAIESGPLALSFQAEPIDNMLRAHGQGLDPTGGAAVYVLSFDDVLGGEVIG